jgi:hypothetical protein
MSAGLAPPHCVGRRDNNRAGARRRRAVHLVAPRVGGAVMRCREHTGAALRASPARHGLGGLSPFGVSSGPRVASVSCLTWSVASATTRRPRQLRGRPRRRDREGAATGADAGAGAAVDPHRAPGQARRGDAVHRRGAESARGSSAAQRLRAVPRPSLAGRADRRLTNPRAQAKMSRMPGAGPGAGRPRMSL